MATASSSKKSKAGASVDNNTKSATAVAFAVKAVLLPPWRQAHRARCSRPAGPAAVTSTAQAAGSSPANKAVRANKPGTCADVADVDLNAAAAASALLARNA
jgi:hypothetical protein